MECEDEMDFVPDYMYDEVVVPDQPQGSMTKGGRLCKLCGFRFTHLHRHMSEAHLPWYFHPT